MALLFLKQTFWMVLWITLVQCGSEENNKDTDVVTKKPLPDLNKPGRKSEYLFNSNEAKAHRIGSRLFKKGDFSTLDEAVSKTKIMLSERRRQWNSKYVQKRKILGIKRKDYHPPGYNNKAKRIERVVKNILKDDNGITDPVIANQMAEKFIKERNKKYYRSALRNKASVSKKPQTSFKPE